MISAGTTGVHDVMDPTEMVGLTVGRKSKSFKKPKSSLLK
jgi:hypothetical protein